MDINYYKETKFEAGKVYRSCSGDYVCFKVKGTLYVTPADEIHPTKDLKDMTLVGEVTDGHEEAQNDAESISQCKCNGSCNKQEEDEDGKKEDQDGGHKELPEVSDLTKKEILELMTRTSISNRIKCSDIACIGYDCYNCPIYLNFKNVDYIGDLDLQTLRDAAVYINKARAGGEY